MADRHKRTTAELDAFTDTLSQKDAEYVAERIARVRAVRHRLAPEFNWASMVNEPLYDSGGYPVAICESIEIDASLNGLARVSIRARGARSL